MDSYNNSKSNKFRRSTKKDKRKNKLSKIGGYGKSHIRNVLNRFETQTPAAAQTLADTSSGNNGKKKKSGKKLKR